MSDDLFSWGKRLAVLSRDPTPASGHPSGGGELSRKHARKQRRVVQMIAELERVRALHWQYFKNRFGWSDRICREVASFSNGMIISFSFCRVISVKPLSFTNPR